MRYWISARAVLHAEGCSMQPPTPRWIDKYGYSDPKQWIREKILLEGEAFQHECVPDVERDSYPRAGGDPK